MGNHQVSQANHLSIAMGTSPFLIGKSPTNGINSMAKSSCLSSISMRHDFHRELLKITRGYIIANPIKPP